MKTKAILSAIAAAAVMSTAAAVTVSAEEAPAGYVAFTAIKSTIGQGFTVEPVLVPFYEGEKGIDVVERAADIQYTDSDYGPFITGFADTDLETNVPDEILAVCPEMTGRNTEGYLSSYDYTAESGWSYFVNGEYAMVGIGDYEPADGDVLEFRFTVYGYGADLGIDNSSWGGAAALTEQVNASELIRACAELNGIDLDDASDLTLAYVNGMEVLAEYGATQSDIDAAVAGLTPASDPLETNEVLDTDEPAETTAADNTASNDKTSPDTGVEGLAVVLGTVILAGGAIALSKKR